MKISCNIIQDLLPLYVDKVCSAETVELVEKHLEVCEDCRSELQILEEAPPQSEAHLDDTKIAKAANHSWKRAKRKSSVRGGVLVLAAIVLIISILIIPYTKQGMMWTVVLKREQLTQYAQELLEQGSTARTEYENYQVDPYPELGMVQFEVIGYVGFFYSTSGKPVGYQGTDMEFAMTEKGWIWRELTGDNWMYVEHIVGNWYWYEMHF